MLEDHAVWVYAITDEHVPHIPATGVASETVRQIRTTDLTAVAGDVPVSRFGEEALRRNLESVEWLGGVAAAHHAVITQVCHAVTAIPMRLATVFLDENRVRDMMEERVTELREVLEPLRGRHEWGVKGYITGNADTDDPARSDDPAGTSGTGYLLQRRARLRHRERNTQEAYCRARDVHRFLAGLAVRDRTHPPQDPKLTGGRAMVLNGSYLVDVAQSQAFTTAVSDSDCGPLNLELTGPWPPYSFITAAEPAP